MELWAVPEGVNLREKFQLKKLKHAKYDLSREQKQLLRKQGHKYYQLMDGSVSPITEQQKHFVAVCKNLAEPDSEWEKTWISYWSTIEEEKRLEAIHRENLRHSPDVQKYLDHLWLGDARATHEPANVDGIVSSNGHSRECRVCRGSGMKANGDNCDRCNGRGSINTEPHS